MKYVLAHFDDLVLKDVAEAGGYGVVFGSSMTKQQKHDFIGLLQREPRRFIAQEVIDFQDLDILKHGEIVPRKADLRAFVVMAGEPLVWKSGLIYDKARLEQMKGLVENPDLDYYKIVSNVEAIV